MMRRGLGIVVALAAAAPAAPSSAAAPGALDGSYGRCGVLTPPPAAARAALSGLVRLPDGSVLAVGEHEDALVTTKLTPSGQIDASFGAGGTVTSAKLSGFTNPIYNLAAVTPQADGRILVAGRVGESNSGTTQAVVARINSDGSLDTSFGSGGSVRDVIPADSQSSFAGVDVDGAGRILLVGERETDESKQTREFLVARLTPNGAPDPAWGAGGVVRLAFPGTTSAAGGAVRALTGGGVLVGGGADEQFALARLRDDGTADPSFGNAGLVLDSPPASARITAIEALPDGRILAAGSGEDINGDEQLIGRYLADGRPDPSFGTGGFAVTGGDIRDAEKIIVGSDGSILVPGDGLARYSPDGVLDEGFGGGGIVAGLDVRDLSAGADGTAIAVGSGGQTPTTFRRFAIGAPALGALSSQAAMCRTSIGTSRVRQLVRRRQDLRYGGLVVRFYLLQPTTVTWTVTVQVGSRQVRIGPRRDELLGTIRQSLAIPLTRRQQRMLTGAKRARVTLTGRDAEGNVVTVQRTLPG